MLINEPNDHLEKGLMSNKRGFTLIEMMVAITIIAILAVGATPAIRNYMHQSGLRHAVNKLRSDLQIAKLEAVKRGANCSITVNQGANFYTYSWTGLNFRPATFRGNPRITNDPVSGAPSTGVITFASTGVSTSPGAIYLTSDWDNDIRPHRLRVTAAGGISEHFYDRATLTWNIP